MSDMAMLRPIKSPGRLASLRTLAAPQSLRASSVSTGKLCLRCPGSTHAARIAGLRGSNHEDGLERAWHVFGNFENYNLRHVIGAAIRNAEIVPALAHLDQSDRDGGHDSQMAGHFCRIFVPVSYTHLTLPTKRIV